MREGENSRVCALAIATCDPVTACLVMLNWYQAERRPVTRDIIRNKCVTDEQKVEDMWVGENSGSNPPQPSESRYTDKAKTFVERSVKNERGE